MQIHFFNWHSIIRKKFLTIALSLILILDVSDYNKNQKYFNMADNIYISQIFSKTFVLKHDPIYKYQIIKYI